MTVPRTRPFSRHSVQLTALTLVAVVPFFACGSKDQPPPNSQYGAYGSGSPYGATSSPYGQPTSPYGTTASPYGTQTGAYPQQTAAPAQTAAPTSAPPQSQLPPQMVQALMAPLQLKYAPGMTAEGAPYSANMTEGQHASMTVSMTAGKCYTIIGASPAIGGVRDLDLTLLTPMVNTPAGSDQMVGPEAVIGQGSRPYCPLIPVAVPYNLDIFAKSGGGPVGVQVYSKTKS